MPGTWPFRSELPLTPVPLTATLSSEKTASLKSPSRDPQTARVQIEKDGNSEVEWIDQPGPSRTTSGPKPTPRRENLIEQLQREGRESEITLKQKLEAAKKKLAQMCLEEPATSERLVITQPPEVIERREREEAMERAERFQLEEEEERRSSQNLSQWMISSECTGHGCQPISVFEVVGGWAGPFAESTVTTLLQVLLLSGVGEKEFPHVYIIGDIIRDGRDHSRLIQKLADRKYKECIFPLNGKVIKKAMDLWGGRCAVARAQYYAPTDVRAPELEGTERGEIEKIRMRWNEEFVKRISMDLRQRDVDYITSDVLVLVP
jgi:hypothetical protein